MAVEEELLEAIVNAWYDRAETYRRLGFEDAAEYVETCAFEIESLLSDVDTDSEDDTDA